MTLSTRAKPKHFLVSARSLSVAALLLGSTCLMPNFARADTTDDLLDKLLAKGILSQTEVDQLKARKATDAPAAQAAPAASSSDATVVRALDKGIGFKVGQVAVTMSGEINGFYVYDSPASPSATTSVAGGLASVGNRGTSSIRNGLLPENLNFDFATKQSGIDIDVRFGIYPGINSSTAGALNANSGGNPVGLGTAGVDFRQAYVTAGTPEFGTVKVGRDIGLYGQEAILGDITLLGVGSPAGNGTPGNTSLGRIGLGYIYTDFQPQIVYTTPKLGDFSLQIGLLEPLNGLNFSGLSGPVTSNSSPQFQTKLSYYHESGDYKLHFWVNGVTQAIVATDTLGGTHHIQGYSFDMGGLVSVGPATFMGYGYTGSGVGTTALFFDAAATSGQARDSSGFIGQGQYNIGKFAIGGSYGISYLNLASGEDNPLLVKYNESEVGQLLYHLTSWDSLIGEFIHTNTKAHGGDSASDNAFALGTIVFF